MDGVLVNSIEAWFKLFNKALKYFGKQEMTWQQFLDKVWGGPIERDAEEFFSISVDELKEFYFDNFNDFKKDFKIFPDAKEVLTKLKDRNLKLGLVTNTPKEQTNSLVDKLGLREYFDTIVGGDETEKGKPAPDMILEACKRLNVKPEETVMIGDTPSDMLSCKNAGCSSIGLKVDGDKKINDLKELLELI